MPHSYDLFPGNIRIFCAYFFRYQAGGLTYDFQRTDDGVLVQFAIFKNIPFKIFNKPQSLLCGKMSSK